MTFFLVEDVDTHKVVGIVVETGGRVFARLSDSGGTDAPTLALPALLSRMPGEGFPTIKVVKTTRRVQRRRPGDKGFIRAWLVQLGLPLRLKDWGNVGSSVIDKPEAVTKRLWEMFSPDAVMPSFQKLRLPS